MKWGVIVNYKKKRIMKFGSRKFYSMLFTSSIGMVIVFIMLLSDTVIAGHFIGETGVSAVNLVLPIFSVTAFFTILIASGTTNKYSLEMGKFDKKRADGFFGQGVILSIAVGIMLFILTLVGEKLYFGIINPPNELLVQAKAYYRAYPYIVLLYPFSGYLTDMIYADGDELISNISYGVQIIGNIAGSIVFCRYFGIAGIAYGTLLSTILSIIVPLIHFGRKDNSLHFAWHFSVKDILHISKYGITDGEQYLCNALMVYVINTFVSAVYGDKFLPIVTVIVSVIEMSIIFDGIGQAFTPLLNVYFGEKNNDGVRDIMKSANLCAVIEGFIFSIILTVFAPLIPKLYGIEPANMMNCYVIAMRILACTFVFSALKYAYSSYYVVKEELYISIIMTLFGDLLVPLAVGLPLSLLLDINGLWIGMAAAPVLALLVCGIMILSRYGRKSFPLLLEPKYDCNCSTFDIALSEESIIDLRNNVENYLKENGVSKAKILKVMLTVEECCLRILEFNKGKTIYLQCSVFLGEENRVVLRDTGKVFDLTDADLDLVSTNAFMVGILMAKHRKKQNLTTIGCNRNELVF